MELDLSGVADVLPKLQIGPLWLILIGVAIGVFVHSKFPNLFGWLPALAKPSKSQSEIEASVAKSVVSDLRVDIADLKTELKAEIKSVLTK